MSGGMTNLFSPTLQYQGWSPLHYAAACGDLERLKLLLSHGADPNYITPGKTALHCACETGNLPIIEALIEGGADPNGHTLVDQSSDREGMCPLYIVYIFNHKHVIRRLADLGAQMNGQLTNIHLCALYGEVDNISEIIHDGNIDLNVRDLEGRTPLHIAAKHGLFSVASKLLQSDRCSVNVCDRQSRTPLDFIVEHRIKQFFRTNGDIEVPSPPIDRPRSLCGTPKKLSLNLSPTLQDNHQIDPPYETALDKASKDVIMCISNGYMNFIKLILDRGVDLKYDWDKRGYSLLHRAVDANDYSLVKLLVGHDKSCIDDVTMEEGKTALHFACDRGNDRLVKFLLEHGASVNVLTQKAVTPLHLAIKGRHRDIVKRLLMKGAETDVVDKHRGHAPIHSAVVHHANDIVELLFAHGANIHIKDRWNKYTILHLAWKNENMKQIERLLRNHRTIMDTADAAGLTTFLTIVYDFIQTEPYTQSTYRFEKYSKPIICLANHGCLLSTSRLAAFQKNPTIRVTDLIFDVYCKENRDRIGHELTRLLLGICCGTYDVIDKKFVKELCYCRHIDMLRFVRMCGFKSFKRKELRNIKDAGMVEVVDTEVMTLKDMTRIHVRRLLLASQNLRFENCENGNRNTLRRFVLTLPKFLKRPVQERSLQLFRIEALPVSTAVKEFLSFKI